MDLLIVSQLTKSFGGLAAVRDLDLTLGEGEIVGLIGPNGAGKTTVFNLITGFLRPDSGKIYFKGGRIENLKPYQICKLGLARTFQLVKPFSDMTLIENVVVGSIFGRSEKRIRLSEAKKTAAEVLEFVKLDSNKDALASNLTYGGKKRLELAKALATGPRLLLLDEVMSGLTPVELEEFMEIVKAINSHFGVTVLLIEHVMRAVMKLAKMIYVLDHGVQIACGSPLEISVNRLVIECYLGKVDNYSC